ncbi:MAG: response regulator [Gemmataceae bacterium]
MSMLLDVNDLLAEAERVPPPDFVPLVQTFTKLKPAVLITTQSHGTYQSITIALESIGYRTYLATDAYVAAERLQRTPEIGLIIIDRRLSEFDGFQLCKMIREANQDAPPVVLLSRKMGLWSRMKAKAAGATGLILKPICPENLIAAVRRQLPIPRESR